MTKLKLYLSKLFTFILPVFAGILGAWTGSDKSSKVYRRILLPALISGYVFFNTESIFALTIMAMAAPLSMGYGIPFLPVFPDIDPGDEGSALGRFWFHICRGDSLLSDICTRGTIGLVIGMTLIPIPILEHNWLVYFIGCVSIILDQSIISWRNLGQYTLFGKKLNWSETITYSLLTLIACLMTYIK